MEGEFISSATLCTYIATFERGLKLSNYQPIDKLFQVKTENVANVNSQLFDDVLTTILL